jgi:membrane-associated protease RseP (regulator of RpoE activity)
MKRIDGRFIMLPLLVAVIVLCMGATAYAKNQAYLGVMLQPLTIDLKEAMDLDRDLRGVLIGQVVDDSPADEYGLDDGDIIIEIDGKEISTVSGATKTIKSYSPGDEVKVVVLRDDAKKVIEVKLGERKGKTYEYEYEYKLPDISRAFKRIGEARDDQGYLGIRIENISEELGEYFGVEQREGVLVLEVIDDSPAEIAGLQAGDVIVEIDGREMSSTEELVSYISKREPGDDVDVTYKRKRRTRTVEVELGKKEGPASMFGHFFPGWGEGCKKSGKHDCCMGVDPGACKIKVMEVPGKKGQRRIQIGADLDDIKDLEHLEKLKQLKLEGLEGDIKVYHMDMDDLHEELENLREEIEELKEEIQKIKE